MPQELPPELEALRICHEAITALDNENSQRSVAVFLAERFAPVPQERFEMLTDNVRQL